MRKLGMVAVILVIALCMTACMPSGAPQGNVLIQDLGEYLVVNQYVQDKLELLAGALPAQAPTDTAECTYYYRYDADLLSDPTFTIRLDCDYESADVFQAEVSRLSALPTQAQVEADGETILVFNGDQTAFEKYLDEKLDDKMEFLFEIAVIDTEANHIRYVACQHWDGMVKDDTVIDLAILILAELQGH